VIDYLEVNILPSGKAVARRKDGLPLTEHDRTMARQLADDLRRQRKQPGITVADVLRVFGGAWIVEQPIDEPKPSSCSHCDGESTPRWRKGGRIVQRTEPDGTRYWACHYCGRRSNSNIKTAAKKKRITK
jgi:hypothetical protein